MLIVLHGRGSNGQDSYTCQTIRKVFAGIEKVFSPTYDTEADFAAIDHHLVAAVELLKEGYPEEELIFVGCSMGGFWARHLAQKYEAKSYLINPSLEIYGNNDEYDHVPEMVFIGLKDDVVNPMVALDYFSSSSDVHTFANGDHRLHGDMCYIAELIDSHVYANSVCKSCGLKMKDDEHLDCMIEAHS